VPLITAFRWDTGVQGHWQGHGVDATAGITTGTLSDPHLHDNNDGKQFSGRVAFQPTAGLIVGTSAARGEFLSKAVARLLDGATGSRAQSAFGADAEYSRDHWLVRAEMVWSRWNMPLRSTGRSIDLDALGAWVEGRYRLTPRIVLAARADHLGFSTLKFDDGPPRTWDAPVTRYEADAGYYFQRNLVARFAAQYNNRPGGRDRTRTYFSGQLAYWF
jgi:predicted porin